MTSLASACQINLSSGSEGDPRIDDRKRKRMLSNRDSARRSRMRKQQRLDGLVNQAAALRDENARIAARAEMLCGKFAEIEADNGLLRAQVMELTQKLQSLNSVLRFVEEFSGMDMDIPEIPDAALNPWQLPCLMQPIVASSSDMLQF